VNRFQMFMLWVCCFMTSLVACLVTYYQPLQMWEKIPCYICFAAPVAFVPMYLWKLLDDIDKLKEIIKIQAEQHRKVGE
jgi:hypothetical protein